MLNKYEIPPTPSESRSCSGALMLSTTMTELSMLEVTATTRVTATPPAIARKKEAKEILRRYETATTKMIARTAKKEAAVMANIKGDKLKTV